MEDFNCRFGYRLACHFTEEQTNIIVCERMIQSRLAWNSCVHFIVMVGCQVVVIKIWGAIFWHGVPLTLNIVTLFYLWAYLLLSSHYSPYFLGLIITMLQPLLCSWTLVAWRNYFPGQFVWVMVVLTLLLRERDCYGMSPSDGGQKQEYFEESMSGIMQDYLWCDQNTQQLNQTRFLFKGIFTRCLLSFWANLSWQCHLL